jgi:hypothetical protein
LVGFAGDGWGALLEGEAAVVGGEAGLWVDGVDEFEGIEEAAAEVAEAGVALAELVIDGGPWDELWFTGTDPAEPLGELCVEGNGVSC